jgi:hypothetical protein
MRLLWPGARRSGFATEIDDEDIFRKKNGFLTIGV